LLRDQDLCGLGVPNQARRHVHGVPEHVGCVRDDGAAVEAHAHRQRFDAHILMGDRMLDRSLHVQRGMRGIARRRESAHHLIDDGLDNGNQMSDR
jgi:hypothetical protein